AASTKRRRAEHRLAFLRPSPERPRLMRIGFPLAKARSVRTARATGRACSIAAVVLLGVALGTLAGCGGGAEKRSPGGAPPIDASRDVPVTSGDGGQTGDRPDTGMPLKPNGQSCGGNEECVSGVCADGVCCNRACADACYTCAEPGLI